jgi:ketosteroid isomerase-like protein
MNDHESEVRVLVDRWAAAVRGRSIAGVIAANRTPDVRMFDLTSPTQLRGLEEYRQTWEPGFFSWLGEDGDFSLDELEVVAGDGIAFCHALIRCAGRDLDGDRQELTARLTIGLRKVDNEWAISHEHHSEPSNA